MFLDLEKAYDRVLREKLWGVLREYGADDHLLQAVKSQYSCSDVCVCVGKVKPQPFTVLVRLWQGCVLSPRLFIIYMHWIDSNSRVNEGVAVGSCKINRLLFAYDLVLLYIFSIGSSTCARSVLSCMRPSGNENQHIKDRDILSLQKPKAVYAASKRQ